MRQAYLFFYRRYSTILQQINAVKIATTTMAVLFLAIPLLLTVPLIQTRAQDPITPITPPDPTATEIPSPTPTPVNLLTNGGFEIDANGDGKPDSWTSNNKFTKSTVQVLDGSYSGRHFATNNAGYTILQVVPNLTAGQSYSFSGWTNIPATNDSFTYKLQIRWRNSNNSAIRTDTVKTYTSPTSGWDQALTTKTAPAGTTNAQIRMMASSLKATIYADSFLLITN